MQNFKNIIFDLGGVILNIDFTLTEKALHELGIENLSDYLTKPSISSFFKDYETGKINDTNFIQSLQSLSTKTIQEEDIIHAWNALLLDFPPERIELLRNLKEKYRLFLLSNTNMIHYREFQQRIHLQTGGYLEDLFEKTYYSHTAMMSKPDTAIFHLVINENKLNPAETLFVDDSVANIAGAKEAGLQVFHIVPGTSILDIKL